MHQQFPVNRPSTPLTNAVLNFSPSPAMMAASGDVVGFYVHGGPHPLQVKLNADATHFTLYKEETTRSSPTTTADVTEAFPASPLISVVFCKSYVVHCIYVI